MPFTKGCKAGPGRPKGSVTTKWYDLHWWFTLVTENIKTMPASEKAEIGMKGLAMLVEKMKALPATPQESAANTANNLIQDLGQFDAAPPVPPNSEPLNEHENNGNGSQP